MHKFDPANKDKLESKQRKEALPAKKILEEMGLKAGFTVADIGAGTGYFSLPAAEMVGDKGLVYAIDISGEMLDALNEKATKAELSNLKLLKSSEHNAAIADKVDFIFISNVVHEVEDISEFFSNYLEYLKPGGKVAIIEWKKKELDVGPPMAVKIGQEELAKLLAGFALEVTKQLDLNPKQYAVVARKEA